MGLITDPTDPRLGHGVDAKETAQHEVYLVLSEEERAKGFIRPVRHTYIHTGIRPQYPLRDLTAEEKERYGESFDKFEEYPEGSGSRGRFWEQSQLVPGCGASTMMHPELAETYARQPGFYGSTYCTHCRKHLPVAEFQWEDGSVVGS